MSLRIVISILLLLWASASYGQRKHAPRDSAAVKKKNFSSGNSSSDEDEVDASRSEAKEMFDLQFWKAASDKYTQLLRDDPKNAKFNYRIGVCYVEGYIGNKKRAIKYLQRAAEAPHHPKETLYQLGRAYHLSNNFDKAIATFEKFIAGSKDETMINLAKRQIEMVHNAESITKHQLPIRIENMGEFVNSPEADYYPFVNADENFIVFTSNRYKLNNGVELIDGTRTTDLMIVYEKKGEWKKVKNMGGSVNTAYDEQIVGMTRDGSRMIVGVNSWETSGDLFVSKKRGRAFQKAFKLDESINSDDVELTACVTQDEQLMYFTSNRPGGYGGYDIWISKRLPTTEWGPAVNAGPILNTEYDEYFPILSDDEMTLFFSSEGHTSIGGFDIFKSRRDTVAKEWTTPVNFGCPINTTDHDMQISFSRNGRTAYFSAQRDGGYGDLDVYRATFTDVEPEYTAVRGVVKKLLQIDYNDYEIFDTYSNGKKTRKFPEGFKPPAPWVFKEKLKVLITPGSQFKSYVTLEKGGEQKKFRFDKAPLDDKSYKFVDLMTRLSPIKGFKKPPANRRKTFKEDIEDPFISVTDDYSGELVGNYKASKVTGKYLLILPPGEYTIHVDADGAEPYEKKIKIKGKASYMPEIKWDITMKPAGETPMIHYTTLTPEQLAPLVKKSSKRR